MNSIAQKQNTPENLDKLAAQRQLYSDAKKIQIVSIIVGVILPIILSILIALFPTIVVYAGLASIVIALLEVSIFSQLQKNSQEKAAKIQQLFDNEVLEFNLTRLNIDTYIDPETIIDASTRFKRKDPNYLNIKNWYPRSVGQLPIHQARIICQRSNVWWDSQLRRRYCKWVLIVLITLTIIIFLIGLIRGLTLEKFLFAIVAQLMPAFALGLQQYNENIKAANRLDKLKDKANNLLQSLTNQIFRPQDLENQSYALQVKIYESRRSSPLIFEWFYSRLKTQDEEQMNQSAETIIQELLHNP